MNSNKSRGIIFCSIILLVVAFIWKTIHKIDVAQSDALFSVRPSIFLASDKIPVEPKISPAEIDRIEEKIKQRNYWFDPLGLIPGMPVVVNDGWETEIYYVNKTDAKTFRHIAIKHLKQKHIREREMKVIEDFLKSEKDI